MDFLRFLLSDSIYILTAPFGVYGNTPIRKARLLREGFHGFLITCTRTGIKISAIPAFKFTETGGLFISSSFFPLNRKRVNLNKRSWVV
jgi:hypothetical protein